MKIIKVQMTLLTRSDLLPLLRFFAQKTARGTTAPNDFVFVHFHRLVRPISIRRNHPDSISIRYTAAMIMIIMREA